MKYKNWIITPGIYGYYEAIKENHDCDDNLYIFGNSIESVKLEIDECEAES